MDDGASTDSELMYKWTTRMPLVPGSSISTVCDGDIQENADGRLLALNNQTYCDADVVPKTFISPGGTDDTLADDTTDDTTSKTESNGSSDSLSTGAVVGISIAVCVVVIVCVVGMWFAYAAQRKSANAASNSYDNSNLVSVNDIRSDFK